MAEEVVGRLIEVVTGVYVGEGAGASGDGVGRSRGGGECVGWRISTRCGGRYVSGRIGVVAQGSVGRSIGVVAYGCVGRRISGRGYTCVCGRIAKDIDWSEFLVVIVGIVSLRFQSTYHVDGAIRAITL